MAVPESRNPFFRSEAPGLVFFSDLFTSRFFEAGLRIPFGRPLGHELKAEWIRAAVSPIPKLRKERRPPASHSRKGSVIPLKGLKKANRFLSVLAI